MLDIVIPSYGRSDRALRVYNDATVNTSGLHEIHFVVESEQAWDYTRALDGTKARIFVNNRSRNYAGAINSFAPYARDYMFAAADDLKFTQGWDVEALRTMIALPHIKVVGTNDLLNTYVLKGWHATHYLVDTSYIRDPGGVIDGDPGHVLFEGYDHNYTDTEFIGTSKARAVFAPCLTSIVEHAHFTVGKSVKDATYEKGYAKLAVDAAVYESRKHLWWDLSR